MEFNYLRVFHEVARCGSFTEASKSLNVSQSALSRAVGLLESHQGVQLLERSKQGVKLTSIGNEVFLRCDLLFQKFQEIENLCRGTRETCEGMLRVATTDHISNGLLMSPLQSFRRRFPLVTPSLYTATPDEIAQSVLDSQSEFGILFVKVPLPQLSYQRLRSEEMVLVCEPEVWKRNKDSSTVKTLKAVLNDVGYIASIGATVERRPSRVLTELFGEMPPIGIEINSQVAQRDFCLAGGGVAYLARFMVSDQLRQGHLFEIPIENSHTFFMWLVTRKGRQLSVAAQKFLEHLSGAGVAPLYEE